MEEQSRRGDFSALAARNRRKRQRRRGHLRAASAWRDRLRCVGFYEAESYVVRGHGQCLGCRGSAWTGNIQGRRRECRLVQIALSDLDQRVGREGVAWGRLALF